MRIFACTLATETNTFSALPTSVAAYQESVFLRPGEHPDDTPLMCTAPLWVARRRAAGEGYTLIEGSCFAASPAGTTNRADYEMMRDEILAQVRAAMPLDGVLLGLHGAMVAHGYDDVEGDIAERVRTIVGPHCVIGMELDPHCHLTITKSTFKGKEANPLFAALGKATGKNPAWNFHKYLIDRSGPRVTSYASDVEPGSAALNADIQKALAEK